MVNTQYIEELIKKKGLKRQFLADKMGFTRQSLSKKLKTGDFDIKDATIICEVLGIDAKERDRIFFAKNVTKTGDTTKEGV